MRLDLLIEQKKRKKKRLKKYNESIEAIEAMMKLDNRNLPKLDNSVWNDLLQTLISQKDSESKYHKLAYLAHDKYFPPFQDHIF